MADQNGASNGHHPKKDAEEKLQRHVSTAFRHGYPEHWELHNAEQALKFQQPTHVTFYDPKTGTHMQWHSRRHRKGRLPTAKESGKLKEKRHFPRLIGVAWNDISWHVAVLFLVGSIWWCINGILAFNYFTNDSTTFANTEAATAFLGGSWFLVGGYLSFVESLNPSRDTDFGYEVDSEAQHLIRRTDTAEGSIGKGRKHFGKHRAADGATQDPELPEWRWWGADWHSIGYVANAIQLFGAVVFWISVLCGLPGILPVAGAQLASGLPGRTIALWEIFYWATQVIGAPPFILSGLLFCIECQKKWWKPEPFSLGWQIGFWNAVGGFGFWFSGIFGILRETGAAEGYQQYGAALSTYWGSWAFLLGSYLQYVECLNK